MKEVELQKYVFNLLKNSKFNDFLEKDEFFDESTITDGNLSTEFSIKFLLSQQYVKSAHWIIKHLTQGDLTLLSGEVPKNMSLDKSEQLYPDFLVHDDLINFFIFELKVGHKTERESITELLAYVFELTNHLPHLNYHEVSLVIISESFKPLLAHAVLWLINALGIKVLCLKFKEENSLIKAKVFNPVTSLTKNELRIGKKAFSLYSICLYQNEEYSAEANKQIDKIYKIAEDMLLESANRLNSNGFCFLTMNREFNDDDKGAIAKYFITIALFNPFEIFDIDVLTDRDTDLTRKIYDLYRQEPYHLQNHFFEIIANSKKFLSKFYYVTEEAPMSYDLYLLYLWKKNPNTIDLKCNVWGEFGAYMKKMIYEYIDADNFFNGEVDHTNPFIFFECLEQVLEPDNDVIDDTDDLQFDNMTDNPWNCSSSYHN